MSAPTKFYVLTPEDLILVPLLRKAFNTSVCAGLSLVINDVYDLARIERGKEFNKRNAALSYKAGLVVVREQQSEVWTTFSFVSVSGWVDADNSHDGCSDACEVYKAPAPTVIRTRSGAGAGTGTGTGADPLPASSLVKVKELDVDDAGFTTRKTKQVSRTGYAAAAAKAVPTPASAPVSAKVSAPARAMHALAPKALTAAEQLDDLKRRFEETKQRIAEREKAIEDEEAESRLLVEAWLVGQKTAFAEAQLKKLDDGEHLRVAKQKVQVAQGKLDALMGETSWAEDCISVATLVADAELTQAKKELAAIVSASAGAE